MDNRYAVIDIGSNTIRMVIYDSTPHGDVSRVIGEKSHLGLISFLEDGCISEKGIEKLLDTLSSFSTSAGKVGCNEVVAFATASLRGVYNSSDILNKVKSSTGIAIDVLSGEQEAELNFWSLSGSFELTDGLMIDIGGGSTEILRFFAGAAEQSISLPFGCLGLYKRFVSSILPTRDEAQRIGEHVRELLSPHNWVFGCTPVVYAIGGTANAASKVYAALYGCKRPKAFTRSDLGELCRLMLEEKESTALLLVGEVPDRLHTIIPGLCGLFELVNASGAEEVKIYTCGLREEYLKRYIDSTQSLRPV